MDFKLENIKSLEQISDYDNEYVYDIEVDNLHNFFANDILVHNSLYVEFGRVTKQLGIPKEKELDFILTLWEEGLEPYLKQQFAAYAKDFNCDENLQVLELEKIAKTCLLYAKKHYAMEECWKEPGIKLNPMEEVIYKGLEVVQGSTPKFARACQEDMIKYVLGYYSENNAKPPYIELIKRLKKYKSELPLQDPNDIAKGSSVGNYDKFILDDKNEISIGLHCPIHVKAAAIYNHVLNNQPNYKMKYENIKTGDKVKFYYAKGKYDVFAFLPNKFPLEFAPPIDYDILFDKTILTPLNRLIEIIGYNALPVSLCYTNSLW